MMLMKSEDKIGTKLNYVASYCSGNTTLSIQF